MPQKPQKSPRRNNQLGAAKQFPLPLPQALSLACLVLEFEEENAAEAGSHEWGAELRQALVTLKDFRQRVASNPAQSA